MTPGAPVEFWFEFSSPYGYIASSLVPEFERRTGRSVAWKPFLLGPVFKANGQVPLVDVPMKGDYSRRDFLRSARFHGVPFALPPKFPIGTVAAVRAFYWAESRDPPAAKALAAALYAAYFVEGRDIGDPAIVVEVGGKAGLDSAALAAGLQDPAIKERAKQEVDAAIARGIFGSPFFIVDGEPFWGCDRLPMVEEWIHRGGW
jgi:2-hydroxychromene-2-carboxylate isomerase